MPVSEHVTVKVLSPGNASEQYNTCPSTSISNVSDNISHNWKNTPTCGTNIQAAETCKLLDSGFDSVSKATDENLMDLEQVISSHSASLAEVDDEYFLKTSSDFHVDTVVNIDLSCISHQDEVHSSAGSSIKKSPKTSTLCPAEPDFPEIYTDGPDGNETTTTVILPHEPTNGSQPITPPSATTTQLPSLITSTEVTVKLECVDKSPDKERFAQSALKNTPESQDSASECKTIASDSPLVQAVTTGEFPIKISDDEEDLIFDLNDDKLEEDTHTHQPSRHSSVQSSKEVDEEKVYNDAEYAAAAVAAVDDVVYALAGNRKPDPSIPLDPSLEGTGTDRLYSLSLAPVHNGLSSASQMNVSSSHLCSTTNFLTLNTNSVSLIISCCFLLVNLIECVHSASSHSLQIYFFFPPKILK
ncbi:unnamed protein product [Trichobilharzia regenti]|nr:unnamed protein product [Trichobilharzia regenti]